jgi:hypothetical protein
MMIERVASIFIPKADGRTRERRRLWAGGSENEGVSQSLCNWGG